MPGGWGRSFFAAACVAYAAALVASALVMPDPVPSHYDGLGRPDDWSSRGGMVVFWALIGVFILGGGWALSRLRMKDPTFVNLPAAAKAYWFADDERRTRFWDLFADSMLALVAWTGVYLTVVMLGSSLSARAGADLPPLLMYGSLVVYLVAVGWGCVSMYRRTRPPAGG